MKRGDVLKKPTTRQLEVLRHMKQPGHLSYGSGTWYFNGESFRIHVNTGHALREAGWVKALPRGKDDPYWRTDYELTPEGEKVRGSQAMSEPEQPKPTCHIHPGVVLVCPACLGAEGGRIGGKASSPKKARAARKNAKRPRPNRQPRGAV